MNNDKEIDERFLDNLSWGKHFFDGIDIPLKEKIEAFIRNWPGISFVEMQDNLPEIKGDNNLMLRDLNIILWIGLSEEFCKIILQLYEEKKVIFQPTVELVYFMDGGVLLTCPRAKSLRSYKKPRWLPVVIYSPEVHKQVYGKVK